MLYLRSLIFTTIMIVTNPLFVIPGYLLIPFPFSVRYAFYSRWAVLNIWLLKVICNLRYEVQGAENIPQHGAIIFSKHQSAWETLAIQVIFPPVVWVLKRELLWIPIFGWALMMLDSIGIDRSSGRKAVQQIISKGTQRLQKGRLVVIFPEGTRMAPGQRKKYGIGGAVLAEHSGYPVVPMAHNAGEYWRRRDVIKHPGVIKVVIGPAIETKGRSAAEINKMAEEWIESTMDKITTLKPEANSMVEATDSP
jgi:1-acyl-sn-glycerol-3-phosphate acyltransferase